MQPMPPCSAPACWWRMRVLGVAFRHVICGFYLFIYFSSWLCCPLRFQNSPQTCWFPAVWKLLSFTTRSPGQVSVPNSFVSLFIFYILSYLLSKRMGCLSGCLVSSTSVQNLFCRSCSAFRWCFDEFVGEKVVSPSSSSAILGLPPLKAFYGYFLLCPSLKWQPSTGVHP